MIDCVSMSYSPEDHSAAYLTDPQFTYVSSIPTNNTNYGGDSESDYIRDYGWRPVDQVQHFNQHYAAPLLPLDTNHRQIYHNPHQAMTPSQPISRIEPGPNQSWSATSNLTPVVQATTDYDQYRYETRQPSSPNVSTTSVTSTTNAVTLARTPASRKPPVKSRRKRPYDQISGAPVNEGRNPRSCWRCRRYKKPVSEILCMKCNELLTGR